MQERTMDEIAQDGRKIPSRTLREFFGQEEQEAPERLEERMLKAAQRKLRDPETNRFFQIRVGRNEPCLCGSGKKFKKCCWGKINQGEFEVIDKDKTPAGGG